MICTLDSKYSVVCPICFSLCLMHSLTKIHCLLSFTSLILRVSQLLYDSPFLPPHPWQAFCQVGDLIRKMVTDLASLLSDWVSTREPGIWNGRRLAKALWYWIRIRGLTMNSWLYLYKRHSSCPLGPAWQIPALQLPQPRISSLSAQRDCRSLLGFHAATLQSGNSPQAESQGRHEAPLLCFPVLRDWLQAFVVYSALCCLFSNVCKHLP